MKDKSMKELEVLKKTYRDRIEETKVRYKDKEPMRIAVINTYEGLLARVEVEMAERIGRKRK